MQDLSLFTYKEAINMISGFYTFTLGFWEFDLEQYPEVKRFIEKGYAEKDKKPDSDPAGTGSGHNFCANLWCVSIIYRTAGVIPVLGTGWKAAGGIYLCRICQKRIF